MSEVVMLYGESRCGHPNDDYHGNVSDVLDVCDHGCSYCSGYEPTETESADGHAIIGSPCKWYDYTEHMVSRKYKLFEAIQLDSNGHDSGMLDYQTFPFVFNTGGKSYACRYLCIDGHVLCDTRGKGNTDDLRQLISDVNDAALYDRSQLEERIEALEQRIAKLENDQMLTMQTSPKKMPLPIAISYLEGMAYVAQRRVRELDALEQRIEAVEWLTDIVKAHSKLFDAILRKLNHKGGDE